LRNVSDKLREKKYATLGPTLKELRILGVYSMSKVKTFHKPLKISYFFLTGDFKLRIALGLNPPQRNTYNRHLMLHNNKL